MTSINLPQHQLHSTEPERDDRTAKIGVSVELGRWIKQTALDIGFDLAGITTLAPSARTEYIRDWIRNGRHGTMDYLPRHAPVKIDPQAQLPWVKSVIALGLAYRPPERLPNLTEQPIGKIAAYAVGHDYHRVVASLLKRLTAAVRERVGPELRSISGVDSTALLERELAARAGLGWIGKNTMVIHPKKGSWFVLGELLTNIEMATDVPMRDHCGTCSRCIDACPTEALAPYRMDATRCISYQLIENRGDIPPALHDPIRNAGYLVGCDICQSVCPHNSRIAGGVQTDASPPCRATISPAEVLQWNEQDWDALTRGRATRRVKLPMWRRNAEILLSRSSSASLANPPAS